MFKSSDSGLMPVDAHGGALPAAPPSAVPAGDYRFIALDVETACSDAASICQIGIACVSRDGAIETWTTDVNPGTRFSPFNIRLHGIGPERVAQAPGFGQAIAWLEPLLRRHHLIQHSSFDRRAINGAFAVLGHPAPPWTWGDSVRIARRAWPEFIGNGGHGLAHLKQRLDLVFAHHDAGEDARAAAQVVLRAEARTGLAFDALLGAGRPGQQAHAGRPGQQAAAARPTP